MSADILQSLKNKFVKDFHEVEKECGEFPLRSHFQEILGVLQGMTISSSTPLQMKDLLYDLGFALAECRVISEERERKAQNKEPSFPWQLLNLKEFLFVHKTRKQLRRIKEKLLSILASTIAAVEPEAEISSSSTLPLVRATTFIQYFDEAKIFGFEDQIRNIERKLLEEGDDDCNTKAIGIVGMGGSGKSTIAKMIFCKSTIREHFNPKIWVWLSEKLKPEDNDSRKIIVKQMLECLNSGSEPSDDLGELLHSLHNQLLGKKYLIVLDNVYHASDWYSDLKMEGADVESRLSHGLPKGSGGAIIVTSRLEDVARQMVGAHNLHKVLPVLDGESCWSIFMDSVEKRKFLSPEDPTLLRMKDEIVDKCDGLPLAAKTLAEIISFQIYSLNNSNSENLMPEQYWSDSSKKKKILLELDIYDDEDMEKARQVAQNLPGVEAVHADHPLINPRRLVVEGSEHPGKIATVLGRVWATEVLSVSEKISVEVLP